MKFNFKSISIIFITLFCLALNIHAQTSQLLNYQGKLTSKDGSSPSGTFTIIFYIYSDTTGTTSLWEEIQTVTVKNGVFNVLLGSVKPISAALFDGGGNRYLGIKVGNDPEMKPRFRLTSVPYAIQPAIPRGFIGMWSGAITDIPYGWALCDGKEYSRTDGQGTIITPDLRNRFIVGAGSAYGIGSTGGADSVALAISQLPTHNHSVTDPGHRHTFNDIYFSEADNKRPSGANAYSVPEKKGLAGSTDFDNVGWAIPDRITSTTKTNISIDNSGGSQAHENRPPYYALAYIMKL